ncbi:hypothetical protein K449DRAFT_385845 [Hypoxylon sp. EC38]|nr:hypothetical protein K449DRAFT_385845 [Hypoxylon sp. EC38]
MGYGQSKWVAEKIRDVAAQHAQSHGVKLPVKILRIGQVAGDTRYGIWNPTETIPIMVQSAITTGTLPITENAHALDTHFWLPVDLAATSIVELALQKSPGKSEGSASMFQCRTRLPCNGVPSFSRRCEDTVCSSRPSLPVTGCAF